MPLKLGTQDVTLKLGTQDVTAYLGAEQVSAFDPTSIEGLAVWLDASKSSSVTLDENGKVSTWTDLTGNGRNATQTTANNRATYTTAGFGGKNCLTFDGSNASSRMILGDLSAVFPTYGEVIIAYEAVSDTQYSLYTTKALQDALLFLGGHYIGTFVSARFSPSPNVASVPSNGSAVLSLRSTGSTFVLRLNGTQNLSVTGTTFEAGTVHTLANRSEGEAGLAFNGKIGEVLLFNADMGATARSALEGYLKQKWGTP
jgi:hypothetical protein